MVDQIMVHLDQVKESHRKGQHDREQRHRDQIRTLLDRYKAHIDTAPPGAKAPKLPRVT